jgi:uncharacterized OB-fold protein
LGFLVVTVIGKFGFIYERKKRMNTKKIPVQEGLFDIPLSSEETIYLNGSRCNKCGRYFFPKVEMCYLCSSRDIASCKLGRKGKLYTYTNCNYPPPGGVYKGKIPYGLGLVLLDEGILITTRISETDVSKLKIGMEVELGIVCFTYNPV